MSEGFFDRGVREAREQLAGDNPRRLMHLLRAWLFAVEEVFSFAAGREAVPYCGAWKAER
jgi:hypothetical protein